MAILGLLRVGCKGSLRFPLICLALGRTIPSMVEKSKRLSVKQKPAAKSSLILGLTYLARGLANVRPRTPFEAAKA
jgi:hypothetical protein